MTQGTFSSWVIRSRPGTDASAQARQFSCLLPGKYRTLDPQVVPPNFRRLPVSGLNAGHTAQRPAPPSHARHACTFLPTRWSAGTSRRDPGVARAWISRRSISTTQGPTETGALSSPTSGSGFFLWSTSTLDVGAELPLCVKLNMICAGWTESGNSGQTTSHVLARSGHPDLVLGYVYIYLHSNEYIAARQRSPIQTLARRLLP
jgi:hypothetical protein